MNKAIHPNQVGYRPVILETITKTGMESVFVYGSPVSIWPQRQYVKLKEFKAQSDKWKMYLIEDLDDRTWAFFERNSSYAP